MVKIEPIICIASPNKDSIVHPSNISNFLYKALFHFIK